MVKICEYDENIEILNNKQMETICKYHKLLVKFNDVLKNAFLLEEQKCHTVLNFYETDKKAFCELVDSCELIDFFIFVWMILIINCIACLFVSLLSSFLNNEIQYFRETKNFV